jgi:hypothetical protein
MTADIIKSLQGRVKRDLQDEDFDLLSPSNDPPVLKPDQLSEVIEALRYCRSLASDALEIATKGERRVRGTKLDLRIAHLIAELETLAKGSRSTGLTPNGSSLSPEFDNSYSLLLRKFGVAAVYWFSKKLRYTKSDAATKVIRASDGELSVSKLRTARERFQRTGQYKQVVDEVRYWLAEGRMKKLGFLHALSIFDEHSERQMLNNIRKLAEIVRAQNLER